MTIKLKFKNLLVLTLIASSGQLFAQLPDEYMTRVNYHQKTEISYSLPSEGDRKCLSIYELANYHQSLEFVEMTKFVDLDGQIETDKKFILEQNVRDDWMKGYGRMIIGKNYFEMYDLKGNLLRQKPRESNPEIFLSPEKAENYMLHILDSDFYGKLINTMAEEGFTITEANGLLNGRNSEMSLTYDPTLQIISTTEYDSMGYKTQEHVTEYAQLENGKYFAYKEIIMGWINGEKGCCIKKEKVITRSGFTHEYRLGNEYQTSQPNNEEDEEEYEITTIQNSNQFIIKSKRYRLRPIEIIVSNMNGKVIMHDKVKEGIAIDLPTEVRAGMYLVHIVTYNRHNPVVGKIIKSNSSNQF